MERNRVMGKTALHGVLQRVRKMAAVQTGRALSDADLLARFLEHNDDASFTVLVERYGAMVLGVCQRALRHSQDAEDACQATFIVLARKAGSLRKTASLASWLHGIACRVCANLKRQHSRRQKRERQASVPRIETDAAADNWQEVQAILDEELQKLPDRYRAPLLLCYWEGKTRDEAAEKLGQSPGKLHGLLERGRVLLRQRLTQRGLPLSAALCASFLTAGTSKAALAPTLVVSCTNAAQALAAGQAATPGLVADQVLSLSTEVLRHMLVTKLKIITACILCGTLLATLVVGSLPTQGLAQNPAKEARTAVPAAKSESDEAFIRRVSKDLRGVEPSPTEVHFFVSSGDAGKRQKLIDLFIQERQDKQAAAKAKQPQIAIQFDRKALQLDGKKLQIEGFPFRLEGLEFVIEPKIQPNVVSLQSKFFRAVAAVKDRKEVSTVAQEYIESLSKYIKDQPKAKDVPDAMLQMEMVYRSLGKNVEAQAWADKLKKEYPTSSAAQSRQGALEAGSGRIMMLEVHPGK